MKTVSTTTTPDLLDEGAAETFTLTLSNASSNAVLEGGEATLQATGTITDDDDPPMLRVADATAGEGDDAVFTVTLSAASGRMVTVAWATSAGPSDTAEDDDFGAASGTLTFAAGNTEKTVTAATTQDADNDDETFTLTLSNPANATFAGGATTLTATGTIADLPRLRVVDGTPSDPSAPHATAWEGDAVSFRVELSRIPPGAVTVDWTAAPGPGDTAEADDLAVTSGSLTISGPNATRRTVTVPTSHDDDDEDETFTLTLSNPVNASFAGGGTTLTAAARIADDEGPAPTVTLVDVQPTESTSGGLARRLELHLSCPDCPEASEATWSSSDPVTGVWFDVVAIPNHDVRFWQRPDDEAAGCAPIVERAAGEILLKQTFLANFGNVDTGHRALILLVETDVPCNGRTYSFTFAAAEFTLELRPLNRGLRAGPAWVVDTRDGFDEFEIVCPGPDCPTDDDSTDDDSTDDDSTDDDPTDDDPSDDDPPTGGGGGGGGGGAAPAVGPQAPVDLSALARPGRLLLAWTAAAQGEPALEFEYRASANGGANWGEWTPIPDSGPAEANAGGYELAGLASGTTYLVEVRGMGDPRLGDARFGAAARVEAVSGTWPVWLFPPAADAAGRQGFARVVNRSAAAGTVRVVAHDDAGARRGPAVLSIGAGETKHFNSADLEAGNAAKGLAPGIGSGQGDWRLALSSALDIEVFAYQRTADGFLTSMHDVAPPAASGARRVVVFNPGGNPNQASRLRLVNTTPAPAPVRIRGVDDAGDSPGGEVRLTLARGSSRTLSALQLERGAAPGLAGALDDGAGKWRLLIEAPAGVAALSLLSSPTGHLTNLSTMPPPRADGAYAVHLFPSAADASGREGFVRVANRSADSGEVRIEAFDDSAWVYDPVTLAIGAGETRHFNSDDLESGNASKGLSDGVGAGTGDWRLTLTSDLAIDVLSYIRTADGFLTSMHDAAPGAGTVRRVAVFNPASNPNQASLLRLVNPGSAAVLVRIGGVDDEGARPGGVVRVTVPAGGSRTLSAPELETGEAEGLAGRLGDGSGKWTLTVESDAPVAVLSLLESVGGRLTNLSTAPYARPLPDR